MNNELNMAITVRRDCYEILDTISHIKSKLAMAKGLGLWDIFGGGMLASIMKRSKIDDIKLELDNLKYQLRNLRNVFNDNSILRDDIDIEITDFDIVFDVFFDNIFTDLTVQRQLNQINDNILNLEDKITELLRELEDRYVFFDED